MSASVTYRVCAVYFRELPRQNMIVDGGGSTYLKQESVFPVRLAGNFMSPPDQLNRQVRFQIGVSPWYLSFIFLISPDIPLINRR